MREPDNLAVDLPVFSASQVESQSALQKDWRFCVDNPSAHKFLILFLSHIKFRSQANVTELIACSWNEREKESNSFKVK